jgi:hypothetical protein
MVLKMTQKMFFAFLKPYKSFEPLRKGDSTPFSQVEGVEGWEDDRFTRFFCWPNDIPFSPSIH